MGEVEFVVGNKNFYGSEIKKKGIINVERLYKELIPWFSGNKYLFTEKGITSKTKSDGKEEKLEWTAYREIDDYFKFHIIVEILILRWLKEKAEIIIRFKGYVEKDYKEKFQRKFGKNLGKFLRKIYEVYFINEKIDVMKGKIRAETNDFITKSKNTLNLLTR